jgi:hypothetical protein
MSDRLEWTIEIAAEQFIPCRSVTVFDEDRSLVHMEHLMRSNRFVTVVPTPDRGPGYRGLSRSVGPRHYEESWTIEIDPAADDGTRNVWQYRGTDVSGTIVDDWHLGPDESITIGCVVGERPDRQHRYRGP